MREGYSDCEYPSQYPSNCIFINNHWVVISLDEYNALKETEMYQEPACRYTGASFHIAS